MLTHIPVMCWLWKGKQQKCLEKVIYSLDILTLTAVEVESFKYAYIEPIENSLHHIYRLYKYFCIWI